MESITGYPGYKKIFCDSKVVCAAQEIKKSDNRKGRSLGKKKDKRKEKEREKDEIPEMKVKTKIKGRPGSRSQVGQKERKYSSPSGSWKSTRTDRDRRVHGRTPFFLLPSPPCFRTSNAPVPVKIWKAPRVGQVPTKIYEVLERRSSQAAWSQAVSLILHAGCKSAFPKKLAD